MLEREGNGFTGQRAFDRIGGLAEERRDLGQRCLAFLDADRCHRNRGHEAAKTGVRGELCQQRLRLGQLVDGRLHLVQGLKQQPVLGVESLLDRELHEFEIVVPIFQAVDEAGRSALRGLGRGAIDDHEDQAVAFRKGRREGGLLLAPRQVFGNQLARIRIDGEMRDRVIGRETRRECRNQDHKFGMAAACGDDPRNDRGQHSVAISLVSMTFRVRCSVALLG